MTLPQWLDDLIYGELGAKYCPRYVNMTNIDDDKEKTLTYLGTYFPRSYAEARSIFGDYFGENAMHAKELSVFDFGSGTGGEIIGLLTTLTEKCPSVERVDIVALDGNQHALRLYEKILGTFGGRTEIKINSRPAAIKIDDFYDLSILDEVINRRFDIIMSFKAICEFVSKDQFERQNHYGHLAKLMRSKLKENGLLLIEDVTTYNDTAQEWLPMMMDSGLRAAGCAVSGRNEGYNQTYRVSHSRKSEDVSKVAWRMVKK